MTNLAFHTCTLVEIRGTSMFDTVLCMYLDTSDLIFFNSGALPNILHYITLHYITVLY